MKRFLIFCGVVILACLYYLLASLNILQSLRTVAGQLHPALGSFFIEVTKPLVLSTISILAYFAGLFLRRNKAEVWAERLIVICALVAALPFVLSFFISNYTDSSQSLAGGAAYFIDNNNSRVSAASPQSNFDALVALAKAGDLAAMLTLAQLYCANCDAAVKLDLRDPSPASIHAAAEELSKYKRPEEDIKEAFRWYEAAAGMGNLKAKNATGEMLMHGVGVLQDTGKAFQIFNESAKTGYVPAQFNLAAMYEYGYGVNKDIAQAHMWYNIIAAGAKDHADEDALYARSLRDALEPKMGAGTVAQASEKARICLASKFQNCR